MSLARHATLGLLLLSVASWGRRIRANEPLPDSAAAEVLFQEGKARMEAHDYAAACPKLAESNRLDPGTGILLALAICHEAWGKTASAWAEFTEVATAARKENRRDREAFATQHVAALAPTLSRLTIAMPEQDAAIAGLDVKRDGADIGSAEWGISLPVDPGEHTVDVSAPGYTPWRAAVTLAMGGQRRVVQVPVLAKVAAAEPAPSTNLPPPVEARSNGRTGRRIAGYVAGAIGLTALGAGAVFGAETIEKNNDAKAICPSSRCSSSAAVSDASSAHTFAYVTDVAIGVGIVGLGLAAYLLLTSQGEETLAAKTALGTPRTAGGMSFEF